MRPDMSKVVTERPRFGHANKSKKTGKRLSKDEIVNEEDLDLGPSKLSSSRRRQLGWGAKEFSDLINPLKRFLESKVGQSWNKIYSELSTHLDKRSLSGQHIWTHVFQFVERNVYIKDGKPYYKIHPSRYGPHEVTKSLYVHPVTGILTAPKDYNKSWKTLRKRIKPEPPTKIKLGKEESLEKIKGIWYYVRVVENEVERLSHFVNDVPVFYKAKEISVTKRQLNSKELKTHKLKNDNH